MSQPFELVEPVENLFPPKGLKTVQAEGLHAIRGHHASQDDGLAQIVHSEIHRARQMPHESPGEAVPRAGRIIHRLQRKGRRRKDRLLREEKRAVFPPLDDQDLRPHLQDFARHLHQVGLLNQLPGLAVVDHHDVHLLQYLEKGFAFSVDPEVHRVQGHQLGRPGPLQHLQLKVGIDVRQEDQLGLAVMIRQLRLEPLEHIELRLQRDRLVELVAVLAPPPERPSGGDGQALQIHPAALQKRAMGIRKILAHHRHHPGSGIVAGGRCKIGGRASQYLRDIAEGGFDGIQRNGSHHKQIQFVFLVHDEVRPVRGRVLGQSFPIECIFRSMASIVASPSAKRPSGR